MHSKYQRRLRHAERAPTAWRRQQSGNNTPTNPGGSVDSSSDVIVGGFTLTGPITLTFLTTVQSTSTSSSLSAISTSSTSSTVQQTSSLSTISPVTSAADSATQTPSTSSSPSSSFPSVILPTTTPSGTSSGNSSVSEQMTGSSALSSTKLPGGSIAGITIGCLIVLSAGLFYLIRSRSKRSQMKLRSMWTRNSPLGISSSSYESKGYGADSLPPSMSPAMRFASTPQPQRQQEYERSPLASIPAITSTPVPRPTYNNAEFEATSPRSALSPRSPGGGSNAPTYSSNAAITSPFAATVVCTFITSLPDELSIKVGETIRILAEYDDGWALCMNGRGEQGMVPLECLNRGPSSSPSAYGGLAPPTQDRDVRGIRRVSSLDPSAPALKVYRS